MGLGITKPNVKKQFDIEKEPLLQPFSPIDIIIALGLTTVILIQAFTTGTVSETIVGGLVGYMGANRAAVSKNFSTYEAGSGDNVTHHNNTTNNTSEVEKGQPPQPPKEEEQQPKSLFDKKKI